MNRYIFDSDYLLLLYHAHFAGQRACRGRHLLFPVPHNRFQVELETIKPFADNL